MAFTFEGVGLLLHRLSHHLPEAVGHGQAKVLSGHLVGFQHALPVKKGERERGESMKEQREQEGDE